MWLFHYVLPLFLGETAIGIAKGEGHTVGLHPRTASGGAPSRELVTELPNHLRGSAVAVESGIQRENVAANEKGIGIAKGQQDLVVYYMHNIDTLCKHTLCSI